jgi:NADP-dependent 3-hydroxy acid dehydrogenase YdfG
VVVITGVSSGIGRATARAFAKDDACIVLAARSAEILQEVADERTAHGAQVITLPTDIRDESQVQALMGSAVEALGRIRGIDNTCHPEEARPTRGTSPAN